MDKPAGSRTVSPRTLGQLHALLREALAIVERKGRITRATRRDLAALLRAAVRYRTPAGEKAPAPR